MNDDEAIIQKLEEALIPFVLQRFDIRNNSMASILDLPLFKQFANRAQKMIMDIATWMARAFVRTLVTATEPMYLSDISTVVLAEALYMLNYPPYLMQYVGEEGSKADWKVTTETELHRWFMFLIERGLLPMVGTYHRYMGRFKPKRTRI